MQSFSNTELVFFDKKVIDFGCSEGKLISKLKKVECIEELVGIDIDLETLEFNQGKAKPFTADYLDPRSNPLTVSFYQGIEINGVWYILLFYLLGEKLVKRKCKNSVFMKWCFFLFNPLMPRAHNCGK